MAGLVHFLLLSGLFLLTQSITRQYVLIQEKKTWVNARAYCRKNHIDLATVQNHEDWKIVQKTIEASLTSTTWIGLYNDIDSWRWSYNDENLNLRLWATGEPTNHFEQCATLDRGSWRDYPCNYDHRFVCYSENGTNRFIFISNFWTTWHSAQIYCRQHYTDLAIIQNESENTLVASMINGYTAWIGLYRDSWKFSNGTNANTSSINWLTGQPDVIRQEKPCGLIRPDGLIEDQFCSNVHPFICLSYSRKQIVRVEVKSEKKLNDTDLQETILQFLKHKLRDHGIEEETKLTWKVQSNGNVFSEKRDRKDTKNKKC